MRRGKIYISSGILYTNHSLSANQTVWPIKDLTLNLLLKSLGESKGDELHNGYMAASVKRFLLRTEVAGSLIHSGKLQLFAYLKKMQ